MIRENDKELMAMTVIRLDFLKSLGLGGKW
jgi:hypothetical protein